MPHAYSNLQLNLCAPLKAGARDCVCVCSLACNNKLVTSTHFLAATHFQETQFHCNNTDPARFMCTAIGLNCMHNKDEVD